MNMSMKIAADAVKNALGYPCFPGIGNNDPGVFLNRNTKANSFRFGGWGNKRTTANKNDKNHQAWQTLNRWIITPCVIRILRY
jgi:hypothetical protein